MIDIEKIAQSFLASVPRYIWDGVGLPVPIEEIADSYAGLLVRDVVDLTTAPGAPLLAGGQSLSGLLLPARGEIWVNAVEAAEWPARRRFTIAHELGHWCLHRSIEHSVFCRTATIDADEVDATDQPALISAMERDANLFAAAVMMPVPLVSERYASCGRDFERLCETFGASGAAMGRRLHAVSPPRCRT